MQDDKKRVGRPKKENANNVKSGVVLNDELSKLIDEECEKNSVSKSEVIRTALTEYFNKLDSCADGEENDS